MSLVGDTLTGARLVISLDSGETVDLGDICRGSARVEGFSFNKQDRPGGVRQLTMTLALKEEGDET